MTCKIQVTTTLYPVTTARLVCYHACRSPYGSVRQILLALDSNSCHNIIKLEQKFPVRNARKANWCNCFSALKAFQVTQDLPCGKRLFVVSLRSAGDG
jgi:hypothetical protein